MSRTGTALITGASRGIGLAIARRLAAEGFDLTVSARSPGTLEPVAQQLRQFGGRVHVAPADMTDEAHVIELVDQHQALHGNLDVLVLSAGVGFGGPLADYPIRRFDTQITVNVRAPFLLIQRALPALRVAAASSRRGAKIIAIASITGIAAEPDLAAYGASKAALISLCESITVAEAEHGVSATAISPGFVDTDMSEWMRKRIDPATMITSDDIAELVHSITRLSRWAAVPNIAVTRPGAQLWRA
jgi:NAD(P)-dependent dehydrogenase (short-subunit alcohol dehydrogenase family)